MNIKRLSLNLGLGLALGSSLLLSETALAQTPAFNSDVTGPIMTTSDVVNGAFIPDRGGRGRLAFRTEAIASAVNQAAASVNSQTANNSLGNVLTGTGNVAASASQLESGLVNATEGINPTLARNVVANLQGLTTNGRVDAVRLAAAVEAYNALINSSSGVFLSEPPDELLAIQSVLAALLNAAFAAG